MIQAVKRDSMAQAVEELQNNGFRPVKATMWVRYDMSASASIHSEGLGVRMVIVTKEGKNGRE